MGLLEGETEAGLISKLHAHVPQCPQEGSIDPFPMADRAEEGGSLFLGGVKVGEPLETEQREPPEAEPPLRVHCDV